MPDVMSLHDNSSRHNALICSALCRVVTSDEFLRKTFFVHSFRGGFLFIFLFALCRMHVYIRLKAYLLHHKRPCFVMQKHAFRKAT